uniref:Zgc:113307 n=1 Tax=Gadus morhua TaxID=8049 RepID=A0A8C5BQK5_GADMO
HGRLNSYTATPSPNPITHSIFSTNYLNLHCRSLPCSLRRLSTQTGVRTEAPHVDLNPLAPRPRHAFPLLKPPQRNNISSLPSSVLAEAPALRWLIVDQNQLEGELLEGPALQNHTELRYLYANHNRLTAVPPGLPEGLRQLRLAYNRISSLGADAFQHLQHLTVLLLQGNRLQTVPSDSFTGTLLVCLFSSVSFVYVFVGFPYFLSVYCDSNLTDHSLHSDGSLSSPPGLLALDLLDLGENRFKAVPAHLPPSLQQLYLSGNNFSELGEGSFAGLDRLKYLRLSRCGLRSPGVPRTAFNVSTLVELDLSYNRLAVTPTVPNSLQYLYLEANEIQEFKVSSFCQDKGPLSYSRMRILRLDGNKMSYSQLPVDWVYCLRVLHNIFI